jgi:uridine kinase
VPVVSLDALARRVRATLPRAGSTTVVAVDGPAGSGKTTLAERLAALLGGAPVVHMDDLYPGWDGLAHAATAVAEQVLVPLAEGRPARYRRWDWHGDRWAEWVEVPSAPILVIEGCGSGSTPGAAYLALLLWVEAPHDVRMARGLERDGDAFRPHWERWARQEDALFAAERTRERADLRIDTASSVPHDPLRDVVAEAEDEPVSDLGSGGPGRPAMRGGRRPPRDRRYEAPSQGDRRRGHARPDDING